VNQLGSIMRWAQQQDEPPIEQVGEDTGEDVETLDEAAPPVDEGDSAGDIELLDQGPPASAPDDVELLDQVPPPATVAEPTAPSTVTTESVTSEVAPSATNGPVVPEGFGTGSVQVATGTAGFPVGLEDCHVGAVTGRAYVGIDCGDDGGSSFVGHAPSFDDFPFVLDEGFPFDGKSVFMDRSDGQSKDNVVTLVSAARGAPLGDDASAPVIQTTGPSSVQFEQRARTRKPRLESDNGRANHGRGAHHGGSANVTSSESQGGSDQASAEAKQVTIKRGKDGKRGGPAAESAKKSQGSQQAKNHGGKKAKKRRTSG
jgi:hypothetical protein